MNVRTGLKRFGLLALVLSAAGILAGLAAVSSARVELTGNGAHKRLLVPVVFGAVGLQVYSGTGEDVSIPGHLDGPVVRPGPAGGWSATWFCQDRVHRARGEGSELRIGCAAQHQTFALDTAPVPPAVAPMPDRVVVLSDLEGNSRFLEAALRKLEVVGEQGAWRFGSGHLVVLGDSVDRGRHVFAVLWRLHDLARQAHAVGGAVHLMLGNHEQYILRGNTSRAHPEHRYALHQMGGPSNSLAVDTVIGAWLRAQPVALKLGEVLFVHGGISPEVVRAGLSVADLNTAMRAYWQAPGNASRSPALDAVLGDAGVTQYRGYFREVDGLYPAATTGHVALALEHFGVRQVVVAHTVVDRIQRLHGGRVIAVDVNDEGARPEVLVYERGVPAVVDIGIARGLAAEPPTQLREFSLLEAADRRLVGGMFRAYRRLADLPQPY